MGGFFTNAFVRSEDQAAVVTAARHVLRPHYTGRPKASFQFTGFDQLGKQVADLLEAALAGWPQAAATEPIALVAPAMGGWVGVYDSSMESQSGAMCEAVAKGLARRLHTTAISFLVHDGDILQYWLAVNGEVQDRFHSRPDYFGRVTAGERAAVRGNPRLLARACGKPEAEAQLQALLAQPDWDAYGLIAKLSAILGMENADLGFRYLCKDYGWEAVVASNPASEPEVEQPMPPLAGMGQFVAITAADLA